MSDKKKKVYGRNIFTESRDSFIEDDTSLQFMGSKITSSVIEKSKEEKINKSIPSNKNSQYITALYVDKDYVSLIQTFYDSLVYTINKVEFVEIIKPEITEANILKGISAKEKLQSTVDAINNVIEKAGIDKKQTKFITGLVGKNIIKQLLISDKLEEEISSELPKLLLSPFDSVSSQYEYQILESRVNQENIKEFDVLACVFDTTPFFNLQLLMSKTGINSHIMDLDTMSLVNLYLESVNPENDRVNCIMDIGVDSSNIIIHSNNKKGLYIRSLDFTYNSFKKILSKNRECSEDEADIIIKERNFYDYLTKAFEQETTENLNVNFSVKNYIKRELLSELSKTFQFYSRQNDNKVPTEIYISGKGCQIKNFVNFLVNNTDIKCQILDVAGFLMGNETLIDKINTNSDILYKTLGLALRHE